MRIKNHVRFLILKTVLATRGQPGLVLPSRLARVESYFRGLSKATMYFV